jgi:hypothetical protein
MKDLELDVQNHITIAKDSEQKRGELQIFIKQTSVQIEHQSVENKTY